ncbi:hypothetical protein DFJ74DRAFT_652823 [Hyaloraphidium curvatum]|nr:hypothetical protein DFJ74DRAFT_652823 [Hyaloraphidium curvatum]
MDVILPGSLRAAPAAPHVAVPPGMAPAAQPATHCGDRRTVGKAWGAPPGFRPGSGRRTLRGPALRPDTRGSRAARGMCRPRRAVGATFANIEELGTGGGIRKGQTGYAGSAEAHDVGQARSDGRYPLRLRELDLTIDSFQPQHKRLFEAQTCFPALERAELDVHFPELTGISYFPPWLLGFAEVFTVHDTIELDVLAHVADFNPKTLQHGGELCAQAESSFLWRILPRIRRLAELVFSDVAPRFCLGMELPPQVRALRVEKMEIVGQDLADWDLGRARSSWALNSPREIGIGMLECSPEADWTADDARTALEIVCFFREIGALDRTRIVGFDALQKLADGSV